MIATETSPPQGGAQPADARLDPPLADINAVGGRERPFPIKFILIACVLLLALIAALLFWAKNASPLNAKAPKQDIPTSAPPPPPKTPEITQLTPKSDDLASGKIPSLNGQAPEGNKPCASVALIDKATGRPSFDAASGLPLMIDCNGRTSIASPSNAIPGSMGVSVAPADRYAGDVLLAKQPGNQSTLNPLSALGGLGSQGALTSTELGGNSLGSNPSRNNSLQLPNLPPAPASLSLLGPMLEKLTNQMGGNSSSSTPSGNGLPIAASALAQLGVQNPNANSVPGSGSTAKALAAKTIDESLTIPKGTQIDCVLTTRVVTEVSGFATCIVTAHVYSANGRTLLIEKMSEVSGEYSAGQMQSGQRSVQVLWTRLRKPGGITIELASPSSDGLGAAGLSGEVDSRWSERIGGALLLSFIKDAITYKTAVDSPAGASALNNTIQQSTSISEKVLSSTIGIQPVLYALQGARISIYVARDLDFSNVYVVKDAARAN